jgi:hypothetical protein
MKNFLVINGKKCYILQDTTKEKSIEFCENYLDQSLEIIVREIDLDALCLSIDLLN